MMIKGYDAVIQVLLFFSLITPITAMLLVGKAYASDITEQIHHPASNKPANSSLRGSADEILRIGRQQLATGHTDLAVENGLKALDLYSTIGDTKSQEITYDLLASAYIKLNNLHGAEDSLRRCLAIARDNQDLQTEIFTLNNLANVLLEKEEFYSAEEIIKQALVIARSVNNIKAQGLLWNNYCLMATRLQDYTRAVKLCSKALVFRRQTGDPQSEATTLNNLGDAYLAIQDYSSTISIYTAALELAKQNLDYPNQLRAINGSITVNRILGHDDKVLDLLEQR